MKGVTMNNEFVNQDKFTRIELPDTLTFLILATVSFANVQELTKGE
jgi:hypothetical protein